MLSYEKLNHFFFFLFKNVCQTPENKKNRAGETVRFFAG